MRKPFEMGLRAAIALLLLLIGYSATSRGFAVVWAKADPLAALRLAPDDARIAGKAALLLQGQAKSDRNRQAAMAAASRALRRDATAVQAAVVFGLQAGMVDDAKASEAWFRYAQTLSRRDMPTQLYFIERAVGEGNVVEALLHYDIAFRVSEDIRPTLYPILEAAIADQPVRTALAKTLAAKPLWADGFMADLATKAPDLPAAAQLFVDIRGMGGTVPSDIAAGLLENLVVHGDVATAWRYYVVTHPGADRSVVRNPLFDPRFDGRTPFDWQMSTDDGVAADLDSNENGGFLDYRVSPSVSGVAARQLIVVPPGRYRLESVLKASSQAIGSGPYWDLKCSDGRPIGTLEMGGPISGDRRFSQDLVIPSGCVSQVLALVTRPSDEVQGATGQVASVKLTSVR